MTVVAIRSRTRRQRRHSTAIAAGRARLELVRDEIKELGRVGQPVIASERAAVVAALMENRRKLAHTAVDGPVPALAPMELDRWVLWRPNQQERITEVRVGAVRESAEGDSLGVPCVVPLVVGRAIVIVNQTDRQRETARALWLSTVTRIAALSAGRSELVLVDPTGTSADHRLFTRVVRGVDVPTQLEQLVAQPPSPGGRFLVVAGVPTGLGPRETALLLAVLRSGAGGTTLVMHLDLDYYRMAIGEPDLGDDRYRWLIDVSTAEVDAGSTWPVIWDSAPPAPLQDLVVDRLAAR